MYYSFIHLGNYDAPMQFRRLARYVDVSTISRDGTSVVFLLDMFFCLLVFRVGGITVARYRLFYHREIRSALRGHQLAFLVIAPCNCRYV